LNAENAGVTQRYAKVFEGEKVKDLSEVFDE
jgi:hypothetical protein